MNQPPPEPPRQAAVAFEVTSLARGRRRVDPGWILIGLVLVLVVAAVVHPWQSSDPAIAAVSRPSASPLAIANPSVATVGPSPPANPGLSPEDALASQVFHLGAVAAPWGAGVGAAVGPPLQPTLQIPALGVATDDAWWAWIKLRPLTGKAGAASATSATISALPVSELCTGVPDLPTGGRILLVTTPDGTPDRVGIQGWHEVGWHDEPRDVEPLAGLSNLVERHTGDVSYLELPGGVAWPDGRYAFQVPGSSPVSLAVCLGQP